MTPHLFFAALVARPPLPRSVTPLRGRDATDPLARRGPPSSLEQDGAASERAHPRAARGRPARARGAARAARRGGQGAAHEPAGSTRSAGRHRRPPTTRQAAHRAPALRGDRPRGRAEGRAFRRPLLAHRRARGAQARRGRGEARPLAAPARPARRGRSRARTAASSAPRSTPTPRSGALLRERFVLHWHSMRPVPKITIDFGDGRVLERTITGNSVHLVLDADGRRARRDPGPLGAGHVPGGARVGRGPRAAGGGARRRRPRRRAQAHHEARIAALDETWKDDLAALGCPHARPQDLDDPAVWTAIAARHAGEARLAPAQRRRLRGETPRGPREPS